LKILEFAFVCYPVTELARARDFYERILGFQPASFWGDNTKGWIEYEVGPHTLALTNFSDDWKPSAQGVTLGLEVEDLDQTVAELENHQVQFSLKLTQSPVCRFAIIQDPDGNKLFIHKRHKPILSVKPSKLPMKKTKKSVKKKSVKKTVRKAKRK
jgi:catechol 2,3-dioxygenase-like lactoylglutathione lyase family enzyme